MLIKLLWIINCLIIIHACYRLIVKKAFIAYAVIVAILLVASYHFRNTAPNKALLLAGMPIIFPVVGIALFFIVYIVGLAVRGKVN